MRLRFPAWTVLLCALAALAYAVPALGDALIYDRAAVGHGQWWRLLTGSLVHLSPRHFLADVPALFVLGALAEQRRERPLAVVYLVAALAVGATVHLGVPGVRTFGGLSGVVTALVVLVALENAGRGAPAQRLWRGVLVLVAGKLLVETCFDTSWLTAGGSEPYLPVPLSHLAGAGAALAFHFRGALAAATAWPRPGRRAS